VNSKAKGRRHSRAIALQILYQMDQNDLTPEEALPLYYALLDEEDDPDVKAPPTLRPFAERIVKGVFLHLADIDRMIASASDNWRLERMSIVDRNILRLALFEMLHCPDIPPKVSINEAIDLGKAFGSADSGSFINGILDHFLSRIASQEVDTKTSSA
jgi:N utilization substance protein B